MFQNCSQSEQESETVEQERSRSLKNVTPLISDGSRAEFHFSWVHTVEFA